MKSANPTAIGAFVLGAVAIAVAGIIFFGSGALKTGNQELVCLFRENVDGLQRGAKVTFKGVPVGTVKEILVRFETRTEGEGGSITSVPGALPLIPVVFEVDASRITDALGTDLARSPKFHQTQVEAGLRAQLVSTSLITGLLQVDLDYYPDAEPATGALSLTLEGNDYHVVPVIPSEFTRLKEQAYQAINQVASLDLEKIGSDLTSLVSNLNQTVADFDVDQLNQSIAAVRETLSSEELNKTMQSFREAADSIGEATDRLATEIEEWPVEDLLTSANGAMSSLESTLENVDSLVATDSSTRQELDRTLTELADAAREIEELAAYLKKHPNSIIFGRKDKDDEEAGQSDDARSPSTRAPRYKRPGR